MHDFLLAKQVIAEVLRITQEKKLERVKGVEIEIGSVSLAHDGMPEHVDEISLESLIFGLESLSRGTVLEEAEWKVKKAAGDSWKIKNIAV